MMVGQDLAVRLLGRLSVGEPESPIELPASRKTRALLAYLIVESSPQPRSWLADLLWDGPRDPRAAVRWSLAKIRPLIDALDGVELIADRDTVALAADTGTVDIHFLRAIEDVGVANSSTESLVRVTELDRGEFLQGLDLSGCHRFDAWRAGMREWAWSIQIASLKETIGRLEDDPEKALMAATRWMTKEPLSEEAHVEVVRLLAELGQLEAAADLAERAVLMVDREFGASPSPALAELRGRLKRDFESRQVRSPDYEIAAARRAVNERRYREASSLIRTTESRLDADDLAGYLDLGELYVHPAMSAYRPPDLAARLVDRVKQLTIHGAMDEVQRGLYLIANLHYQAGDFELAYQKTTQAERAGRAANGFAVVSSIADTARCLAMLDRDFDRAVELAEEAHALEAALDEPLVEIPMALGLIRRHQGRNAEAAEHMSQALDLVRRREDDWWESYCLVWLMMIQMEGGSTAEALVTFGELNSLMRARPGSAEMAFAKVLADIARLRLGHGDASSLQERLDDLRDRDAGWMLAYALLSLAEEDVIVDQCDDARSHAVEALHIARALGRPSEIKRAENLLEQIA